MFFKGRTIEIQSDEELTIGTNKKNYWMQPFTGIGSNYQTTILVDLSKGARIFLDKLIKNRDIKTNEAVFKPQTPSEKTKFSKAYKELKSQNIAVRIRKQTYFLNPDAVIPKKTCLEAIKHRWDLL